MPSMLIIEDDHYLRALMKSLFPTFSVRETDGGEEGISLFQEEEQDVVLLDINLKGIDGLQVIEKLREGSAVVPIVVVTADMSQALSVRCFRLGATDFVPKPFDPDYLHLVVERCLRQIASGKLMREIESNLLLEKHVNELSRSMLSYFNHELRTPLHHALSFISILGEELEEVQSERVRQFYTRSLVAVEEISSIVSNFMQISSAATGECIEDNDTIRGVFIGLLSLFDGKITLSMEDGVDYPCKSSLRLALKELIYHTLHSTQKMVVTVCKGEDGIEIQVVSESPLEDMDPYRMLIIRRLLSATNGTVHLYDRSWSVRLP